MDEFQDYVLLRNTYHAAIREVSTKLEILDDEFQVRYDYNPIHHMECRLKSPQSLFEKLERKGLDIRLESFYKITDIAGIRVICNYIDDVYAVASLLLQQDDIKLLRRSDYIKNPKESGYRSLHLVVQIPVFLSDRTEMVPVEIQFRTIAMDTWASLEHELKYKRVGGITSKMEAELKECAEAMAEVDRKMEQIHKEL
ncbi:GTP pyrophosphokinase family protein [Ihubacter massiliensis]|uniref:GTP pyrophosphokinase family protein n=2 Tax=Peptostreptococcales TaxID=3082720 RepID=A0A9J6QY65_9FIRM|nr:MULTISPECIES: GTP pyrophosphokinase family protein [Eubacteriales Family XIII. Incertae Sedis]MCC2864340.1 GTP pyrophosphokinase family protein [Anaerovorax odorimutans]MDE8733746.1 GTP pyrophosphokinase family protein [Eubacteriales bacterium DFI.9.88]MDY3010766.1 GTP pyrophosphokinase family protein [Clostridiales Family XIII bacterium]MCO7120371.1 GTP pyrophosphokinase family protein [Ihubacter massiliensis]MCU7380428.1 GTP pyrophosphokinase family protein [Hominibacterium faecale]